MSYLRCIPNLLVMTPSDENESRHMLFTGFHFPGPAAVRYPRGKASGCQLHAELQKLDIGKAVLKRQGEKTAILVFGTLLKAAEVSAQELNATLVDMRFVKPLDEDLLRELAASHHLLVTVEENVIKGGAGSAVNEFLHAAGITTNVLNLGLPDRFLDQGKAEQMLADCGLDSSGITAAIIDKLHKTESSD